MSSLVTRRDKKGALKALQAVLDIWRPRAHNFTVTAMVHGSDPLGGSYPAPGFVLSFSLSISFPSHIPDAVIYDPIPALRPLVSSLDGELAQALAAFGYTDLAPYWNQDGNGFSLAHHFLPFGDESPDLLADILSHFRPTTPQDPTYGSPFSDEQYVEVRYAGINLFRTVQWRAPQDFFALPSSPRGLLLAKEADRYSAELNLDLIASDSELRTVIIRRLAYLLHERSASGSFMAADDASMLAEAFLLRHMDLVSRYLTEFLRR